MSNPEPSIRVKVDVTNPGQFFACCGLLELADRLWPGAEGWFYGNSKAANFFVVTPDHPGTLKSILECARSFTFNLGKDSEAEDATDNRPTDAIEMESPKVSRTLILDWWSEKSIKPWAGSMKERYILHAMLQAINPDDADPFNDSLAAHDPIPEATANGKRSNRRPKKREPFYFDCRRGSKAHPIDSGWSPDAHHRENKCFPAVEALCFLGLQRCRPQPLEKSNTSRYTVWHESLPICVLAPVICGAVPVAGSSTWKFTNFFRTGERKHKAFGEATQIKS